MALRILTSADYPTVRQAIRLDVTKVQVTDAMIEATTMGGAAEREVLRLDPLALNYNPVGGSTPNADIWEHVRAAAIYLTAAYLAPAVPPPPTQETEAGEYEYTRPPWKPLDRVAALRAQFEIEMASYLTVEALTDIPTVFTTVGPAEHRYGRRMHTFWGRW